MLHSLQFMDTAYTKRLLFVKGKVIESFQKSKSPAGRRDFQRSAVGHTDRDIGVCPVQVKSTSLHPIDSPATIIAFASTHVCTFTEEQNNSGYVLYTGGIAGISDSPTSKTDTESLNRSTNEIELHRQRVDGI